MNERADVTQGAEERMDESDKNEMEVGDGRDERASEWPANRGRNQQG